MQNPKKESIVVNNHHLTQRIFIVQRKDRFSVDKEKKAHGTYKRISTYWLSN